MYMPSQGAGLSASGALRNDTAAVGRRANSWWLRQVAKISSVLATIQQIAVGAFA